MRTKISEHFTLEEFDTRKNLPSFTVHETLLNGLEKVRKHFNKPITITSGARSLKDNVDIYKSLFPGMMDFYNQDKSKLYKFSFWKAKITFASRHLFQLYSGAGVNTNAKAAQYFKYIEELKAKYPGEVTYNHNNRTFATSLYRLYFDETMWSKEKWDGILCAADFVVADTPHSAVQRFCETVPEFGGLGISNQFTHVDSRERIDGRQVTWFY